MIRKAICAGLLAIILGLAGCMYQLGPGGIDPPALGDLAVRLLTPAVLYAPKVNDKPFGYQATVPLTLMRLDFSGGPDQYGNPTGLSDPVRWQLVEVRAQCEVKTVPDTIFWPSSVYPVPHVDLGCVWFPGWTAPIEKRSGLPIPFMPLDGYPWSACRKVADGAGPMAGQNATITAIAQASVLEVEFTAPEREGGSYQLDRPGTTPTAANVFRYHISEPGTYAVTWTDGDAEERFEVEIPADWFWITGSWPMRVEPTGGWSACDID